VEGASKASLVAVKKRLDEVAGENSDRREIGEQLFAFADLLDRELRLRRALADAGSEEDARRNLVRRVLGNQVSDDALELVSELVGSRWSSSVDLLVATDELAAQALFSAEESGSGGPGTGSGSLDEIEDELFRFSRLVAREPRLALALSNPALPADRKSGLIERLLGDRATGTTQRLVQRVRSSRPSDAPATSPWSRAHGRSRATSRTGCARHCRRRSAGTWTCRSTSILRSRAGSSCVWVMNWWTEVSSVVSPNCAAVSSVDPAT
jgi:F-type H+-transporting ATPase subunit delta